MQFNEDGAKCVQHRADSREDHATGLGEMYAGKMSHKNSGPSLRE